MAPLPSLPPRARPCSRPRHHLAVEQEVQQLFQMSGVVRAFTAIDREHLEERLVAFEKETGCRIGITETDPDPSYSAFRSTTIRPPATAASKPVRRLVKTITGA